MRSGSVLHEKKNIKKFIKLDAHGVFMEKFCNLIKLEPLVHLKKCDPTKLNNYNEALTVGDHSERIAQHFLCFVTVFLCRLSMQRTVG